MSELKTYLGVSQSHHLASRLFDFCQPLLKALNARMDKRLVRTFFLSLLGILSCDNPKTSLVLSNLGGLLLNPRQAPAGTKRLERLLSSEKWEAQQVHDFLMRYAEQLLEHEHNSPVLALWDESVLEKPESFALESLMPVRSSKGKRLTHIKPGFFTPPRGPIFVPGFNCMGVMLVHGNQQRFAAMKLFSSRAQEPKKPTQARQELFEQLAPRWGQNVVHVFDRGFCGDPWLKQLEAQNAKWLVRYRGDYRLTDDVGRRKVWRMFTGRKSLDTREQWDNKRKCHRPISVLYKQVRPRYINQFESDTQWTLVMCRHHGKGKSWYLLTNQEVNSTAQAWMVVDQYAKRWCIEQMFRQHKSALGYESPRVYKEIRREKLLSLVHVVWSFLMETCRDEEYTKTILRNWCHRTGKRQRQVALPFYRLRAAIALMLIRRPFLPQPEDLFQNSG